MVKPSEPEAAPLHEADLIDPATAFGTPEALLANPTLPDREKIEILRRWEYDASEACVALEEGMPGAETDLLHRILLALDRLTGGIDVSQTGPTKQDGIPRSAVAPMKR